MKRILFVDDEPNVLSGLRRMLFPMRKEWDMEFCGSGQEALDLMAKDPVDVIVTDMRMPGMDGTAVLRHVMEKYPQTVRFVLSGQSDKETILRTVGAAHTFLSKPCSADVLKSCVDRAFALRDLLGNRSLKSLVAQVDALPALPQTYQRVKEELASEDASVRSVGKIIESDLGMTAKVLQLVNSAFVGLRQGVSDVTQAVSMLGLDTVRSLLLMVGAFDTQREMPSRLPLNYLWEHGMTVGRFAQGICKAEEADEVTTNQSFTAGLLHDAGILVLATNYKEDYERILEHAKANQTPLHRVELETFGCTHAQVGAYLLGIWGLPDSVVEAVAYHHSPSQCLAQHFGPLMAVHAADALDQEQRGPDGCLPSAPLDTAAIERMGLAGHVESWRSACQAIAGQ